LNALLLVRIGDGIQLDSEAGGVPSHLAVKVFGGPFLDASETPLKLRLNGASKVIA
jgi:hypothetical protein